VFELGLLRDQGARGRFTAAHRGQCMELYPDKRSTTFRRFPWSPDANTESLLKQIEPFHSTFHLGQTVSALQRQDDGRFLLETSRGTRFLTRTRDHAAGVGAFEPRDEVEGLSDFENTSCSTGARSGRVRREALVIAGVASALDWALNSARRPHSADSLVLDSSTPRVSRRAVQRGQDARAGSPRPDPLSSVSHRFEQAGGRLVAAQLTGADDQCPRVRWMRCCFLRADARAGADRRWVWNWRSADRSRHRAIRDECGGCFRGRRHSIYRVRKN